MHILLQLLDKFYQLLKYSLPCEFDLSGFMTFSSLKKKKMLPLYVYQNDFHLIFLML